MADRLLASGYWAQDFGALQPEKLLRWQTEDQRLHSSFQTLFDDDRLQTWVKPQLVIVQDVDGEVAATLTLDFQVVKVHSSLNGAERMVCDELVVVESA